MAGTVIPYTWSPEEQRDVAGLALASSRFFQRIGRHVEDASLTDEVAREGIKLAQHVVRTTGVLGSPAAMRLHAKNLVAEGKLKREVAIELAEIIDHAADRTDADSIADAIAEELRRRAEREAVGGVISAISSKGDRRRAAEVLLAATNLGAAVEGDLEPTTSLTEGLEAGPRGTYLPTGVRQLDEALNGGLRRATMGFYLGNLNEGKSMQLTMQAAHAMKLGCRVALASNENSVFKQKARIFACLTRVPLSDLEGGSKLAWTEALQRFGALNIVGSCHFKFFPAGVSKTDEIFEWVEGEVEPRAGGPIDLLISDHLDNVTEDVAKDDKQRGAIPKRVYEKFRAYVVRRNLWGWTASHAVRKKTEKAKQVEILRPEHTANCIDKARIADLGVSINFGDPDGKTTIYAVVRNRDGDAGAIVGPLDRMTHFGLIAPMGAFDDEPDDPFAAALNLPGMR